MSTQLSVSSVFVTRPAMDLVPRLEAIVEAEQDIVIKREPTPWDGIIPERSASASPTPSIKSESESESDGFITVAEALAPRHDYSLRSKKAKSTSSPAKTNGITKRKASPRPVRLVITHKKYEADKAAAERDVAACLANYEAAHAHGVSFDEKRPLLKRLDLAKKAAGHKIPRRLRITNQAAERREAAQRPVQIPLGMLVAANHPERPEAREEFMNSYRGFQDRLAGRK